METTELRGNSPTMSFPPPCPLLVAELANVSLFLLLRQISGNFGICFLTSQEEGCLQLVQQFLGAKCAIGLKREYNMLV